ncbi:MAG: pilus assembly protein N-terminal domain-containing protein [Acidobacteriaceae bacterium]|nr:pilus assembly protein N-terminal domain-containing protein [Acidobacteriaceae bacterium]MBV9778486.1 pilus assembly protein N-terminal domain-containing protein [Acidobacteriaceae bacterium]
MKPLIATLLSTALLLAGSDSSASLPAGATATAAKPNLDAPPADVITLPDGSSNLKLTVNESAIVQHGLTIRRVSVANSDIAEAVAVSANEVLVNGKAPGETSLILWDARGDRTRYEVQVEANESKIDAVRRELSQELTGQNVSLTLEEGNVFLRGTVNDVVAADRATAIASTLGKVINLLRVTVPARESQVLLKVRFANVDRSATLQLGTNLFTLDRNKNIATTTTGQFGTPPAFDFTQSPPKITISNLLNVFYYRPDINLGAIIQALQARQLLEILAEPNLLTMSGRPASFLAGGEFPFPTLQGGAAGIGQITIQFKEFGIRLNFVPTITPRGTIHLEVSPEVSSLDYANGLTVNGFTMPGLSTRRVRTELELESGQSFVIAGLLDNQVTESLNKIPGLANIPLFGKLFQSRNVTKNNTELLVMVTPELVGPIPAGVKPPEVKMPMSFLNGTAAAAPQNPGPAVTGPLPPVPHPDSLPIEEMKEWSQSSSTSSNNGNNSNPATPVQALPAAVPPVQASPSQTSPQASPPQTSPPPATGTGSQPNPGGSSH